MDTLQKFFMWLDYLGLCRELRSALKGVGGFPLYTYFYSNDGRYVMRPEYRRLFGFGRF